MSLDSYEYGDPAKVAEIHEQRAMDGCKGCIHLLYLWGMRCCAKHEGKAGSSVKRCDDFTSGRQDVSR